MTMICRSDLRITIPGTPVGQGRPRFAKRGNFVKAYTPEKTANYENLVALAAHQAMAGRDPHQGPLVIELLLVITPPASWSNKKQMAALRQEMVPTTKPDIDNTLKGILDACNGIVWADDKQVVKATVEKRYGVTAQAVLDVFVWPQSQHNLDDKPMIG